VRSGEQIDELAEFLRERGVSGPVQVRECAGGIGRIHRNTMMNVRNGNIQTAGSGFPVLVRRMEI